MSRSVWKGPFVNAHVLKKAEKWPKSGRNEVVKIWWRRLDDPAPVRGADLRRLQREEAHAGQRSEDMIGQKFGEYSPTRTYYGHAADKKAKRKAMGKPKTRALKDNEAKAVLPHARTSGRS